MTEKFHVDLRDTLQYRKRDLLVLLVHLVVIAACVLVYAAQLPLLWPTSLGKGLSDSIATALSIEPAVVYGFLLFVFLGVVASAFLRPRHRQFRGGLLAIVAVGLIPAVIAVGRLGTDWISNAVVGVSVLGGVTGLLLGRWTPPTIHPLRGLMFFLFALSCMVLFATRAFSSLMAADTAVLMAAFGILPPFVLLLTIESLAVYGGERDVVIIGPSRAGKTWFLAGLAYTFNDDDVDTTTPRDTVLSSRMEDLYNLYESGAFEQLGPTGTNTAESVQLETNVNGLLGGRLRIRSADYAGEHLADLDLSGDEPLDVPSKLREKKQQFFDEDISWNERDGARRDGYDIPDLLRVLVADADVVCLVQPLDAVLDADAWDDDFDDPLRAADLKTDHDPPKVTTKDGERGYYDIYNDIRQARDDVVFLGTKADFLTKAFADGRHVADVGEEVPYGESPPQNHWPDFRTFVWKFASEQHTKRDFRPTGSESEFFPVYFESENERTDDKDLIKPLRERDEGSQLVERKPIRGLNLLLRRIR